jgi:hypothetical protein
MTIEYYNEPMDDNTELFFCAESQDQVYGLEGTIVIDGKLCCAYCITHSDIDDDGIHEVEEFLGLD